MKRIVLLGDRDVASPTHRELDAAVASLPDGVTAQWVGTDTTEAMQTLSADGLWVVPGSPYRSDAAVYLAITSARTSGQPFLGTCGGFQYTVIEFARHVAGVPDAGHAETAPPDKASLVVERLQCSLVGQARSVVAVPGTRMHSLCGSAPFPGFHWCNYGLSPRYTTLRGTPVRAWTHHQRARRRRGCRGS
jgi:CTP synthase (UTP-ammonia lyase)